MESKIAELFTSPLRVLGFSLGISFVAILFIFAFASSTIDTHGAQYDLSTQSAVVMQGQRVYIQEGCQYCHTQNIRPFSWELRRFSDIEALGHSPASSLMEYYFEAPLLKGSRRIGPDLSRTASLYDEAQLRSLLRNSKSSAKLKTRLHQYAYLFEQEITEAENLALSRRIAAMLQFRAPFSDIQQRNAFANREFSRGDALVFYLLSRGQKQVQFNGKYYNKE